MHNDSIIYAAAQAAVRHFLDLNAPCRAVGDWPHGDEAQGAFAELVALYAGPAALHRLNEPLGDIFTERGDERLAGAIAGHYWPNYHEALYLASIIAATLIENPDVWLAIEAIADFMSKASTIDHPSPSNQPSHIQ